MTWQPLGPLWLIISIFIPVLTLTIWQATRGAPHSAGPMAWWRRTAIVTIAMVMGLGPSTPQQTTEELIRGVDVFFVVDRTGSMAAEDYHGKHPRMDGVRHDIIALTTLIPDARYGAISFDSEAAQQLPLTSDVNAIHTWVNTVDRELTLHSQGSLTDRPFDPLQQALRNSYEDRPDNSRVVFFLSDGEQTAEGTPRSYADLAPLIDGGAVLGYGTSDGGPMKTHDMGTETPDPLYIENPETGEEAISIIDETTLTTLADQLGVTYLHRTSPDDDDLKSFLTDEANFSVTQEPSRRTTWRITIWPLALAMAGLLMWEAWTWTSITRQARGGRR